VGGAWGDQGDVDAWAAGARAQEAAAARTRQRWLRQQAAEQADFASLLVDLHEQGTAVAVTTAAGRCHPHARIASVGRDYIALATARGRVLLSSGAVVAVQPHDERDVTLAVDMRATRDESMAEVVRRAAHDRKLVTIHADGAPEPFVGELQACGRDVVVIRLERTRAVVYLTLASVSEMSFDSG
jgi:hypothetical protein